MPEAEVVALDATLDVFETQRSALPWHCAASAAKAFSRFRKRGGVRRSPLPDFFIATPAAMSNLTQRRNGHQARDAGGDALQMLLPTNVVSAVCAGEMPSPMGEPERRAMRRH